MNGGLQFPFGGNGRGGGGVISMGGMQAAGLPAGSPPGGYAGLSTGYGGLQNPSAFGDNFNDQSSFIVPGNMPGMRDKCRFLVFPDCLLSTSSVRIRIRAPSIRNMLLQP